MKRMKKLLKKLSLMLHNQKGNGGLIFIFIIIAVIVILVMLPGEYSQVPIIGGGCPVGQKPTEYEELTGMPPVEFVDEPNERIDNLDTTKTDGVFVLIRKNVPVPKASEIEGRNFFAEMKDISRGPSLWVGGAPTVPHTINIGEWPQKKGYYAFYPRWEASVSSGGRAYFAQQKIIFLVKTDPKSIYEGPKGPIYTVDIYVEKDKFNPSRDYEKELFECTPAQLAAINNPSTTKTGGLTQEQINAAITKPDREATAAAGFYIPDQVNSPNQEQLQLQYFLIQGQPLATWSTHCKPAVYLYPPKRELVNVKVLPAAGGSLKYTDPLYDEKIGWNVLANPDGKLINLGSNNFMKNYDYLYFESRIPDSVIKKPTKGWIIPSPPHPASQRGEPDPLLKTKAQAPLKGEGISSVFPGNEETLSLGRGQGEGYDWFKPMESKFNEILPKLGLNDQQTRDFIDYWQKALPFSPYYFIGIIDPQNVDQIEKLDITPKPESINRVRIYFERLDEPKTVEEPDLTKFGSWSLDLGSSAFRAVEWGGMVKNDPNHPFTCSQ